jgi:hypothetical protein
MKLALDLVFSAALMAVSAAVGPVRAQSDPAPVQVRLEAVADTTIFANQGGDMAYDGISDGSGPNIWTSVLASGTTRRALVRFDLSSIPAGSRVVSASLQLFVVRARDEHDLSLHRILSAWGEGASNGGDAGVGAPAQTGDATWSHRIWPDTLWNQRGGDFVSTVSAVRAVGFGPASYTIASTPALVADVQSWLQTPGSNHGWMLIGNDQGSQNAKRLASRQSSTASARPTLVLDFQPAAPESGDVPLPPWALALLAAGVAAGLLRRRRS